MCVCVFVCMEQSRALIKIFAHPWYVCENELFELILSQKRCLQNNGRPYHVWSGAAAKTIDPVPRMSGGYLRLQPSPKPFQHAYMCSCFCSKAAQKTPMSLLCSAPNIHLCYLCGALEYHCTYLFGSRCIYTKKPEEAKNVCCSLSKSAFSYPEQSDACLSS
jgi:hypothetical protein